MWLVKRYMSYKNETCLFLLRGLKKNIYYYIMKCEICNYETKNKQTYDRHLNSKNHKEMEKALNAGNNVFECAFCKKKYLRRTSFWRHKKNCKKKIEKETKDKILEEEKKKSEKIEYENNVLCFIPLLTRPKAANPRPHANVR